MDAFKLGRLFKGEEYTISLPLPFTGEPDTFKLYFYTDNETTVEIPYNDIVISGNVAEIKFEETTLDPLNDGVLKYYLEYSINSATKIQHTNTMHYLKSPADYNSETTTDIYNNGYESGYTQGLEDAGGEYADGYAAGIAEQKSKLSGITITENGEYTRADGYSGITVNVPQTGTVATYQTKNFSIDNNGDTTITVDDGYDGITGGTIHVSVPQTGSTPVLETLNVTPTTSQQTITPTGNTDGYDEVVVAAVNSSIDSNITTANIRQGVSILGVTGALSTNGCYIWTGSQAQYDALQSYDNNTVYLIV